jgi:type I restriction enzyme, S subunit
MKFSSSWQRTPIGRVCVGIYDGPHATPKVSEDGPIFLGIKNITEDGHLDLSEIRHISENDFPKWTKRVAPKENDIVFTYEATLNRYAIIPKGFRGCLGRRLALIRTDPRKADFRFIFLYFFSDDWRRTISQNLLSGATVDRIPIGKFPEFEISLPPLELQTRIADILSAYDRLIENNTRRIKILEEMAQNLYREWFVNFRFPGHEQTKLIDSGTDLGQIPEGWEVRKIKDLPIQIIDGDRSAKYPKSHEFRQEGIPFLSTKNIDNNKLDLNDLNFISLEKFAEIKKGRLKPLDIVMTTRGSIGKIALFDCEYSSGLINAQMLILRAEDHKVFQTYLFCIMCDSAFQESVKAFASGSAQPQIPIRDLREIQILVPEEKIQGEFDKIITKSTALISNLQKKNNKLRQTRDLLLPKLISGEIDVESLDMDKEAIAA